MGHSPGGGLPRLDEVARHAAVGAAARRSLGDDEVDAGHAAGERLLDVPER